MWLSTSAWGPADILRGLPRVQTQHGKQMPGRLPRPLMFEPGEPQCAGTGATIAQAGRWAGDLPNLTQPGLQRGGSGVAGFQNKTLGMHRVCLARVAGWVRDAALWFWADPVLDAGIQHH